MIDLAREVIAQIEIPSWWNESTIEGLTQEAAKLLEVMNADDVVDTITNAIQWVRSEYGD